MLHQIMIQPEHLALLGTATRESILQWPDRYQTTGGQWLILQKGKDYIYVKPEFNISFRYSYFISETLLSLAHTEASRSYKDDFIIPMK